MEAMVFAAGLGTRLRPLTDNTPKALVEVGGVSLLEHNIRNLIEFGCSRIVVNVHHFAEQIIQFLREHRFDTEIVISDERNELLDTGGGLKKAESLFSGKYPILIHNVDVLSTLDLKHFYAYHCQQGAIATVAVSRRTSSRYFLFDDQYRLVGWQNQLTHETQWAAQKPIQHTQLLAFSGIHVVNPEFLKELPPVKKYSIISEYLRIAQEYPILAYPHHAEQWMDVGKPETLQQAEHFLLQKNKYQ